MPQDYAENLNKYPPLHTVLHHNARPGVLHWLIHERSCEYPLVYTYFNRSFEPVFPAHVCVACERAAVEFVLLFGNRALPHATEEQRKVSLLCFSTLT